MPLLEVEDLAVCFRTDGGVVRAVAGASFAVDRGEVLCLVGESGSGKSVACLSLLGLVPRPPAVVAAGHAWLRPSGEAAAVDLLRLAPRELRRIRGNRVAVVFQDPMSALNPYLRVGAQLAEVLEIHRGWRGRRARERVIEMLAAVGIAAPAARAAAYPHELSGGMRQRVLIAMALLCRPDLLIADEPTTALDATVQAQILELVLEQVREHGLAVILVTHDMGVVARTADRVAVMYAGHVVERGPAEAVLGRPAHPYTRALLASTPRLDAPPGASPLPAIRGTPATGLDIPSGCPFHPRCDVARDECAASFPEPRDVPQPGAADEATAVAPDLPKHCVCCHVERGTP